MSWVNDRWLSTFIVFAICFTLLQAIGPTRAEAAETRINVVVLGDSYSSGTGGTDYHGPSGCYRSNNGYGGHFKKKISGMEVNFINLACHGAVTDDLTEQLFQLSRLEMEATDLVFLTIGGNDGGFENIVRQCLVDVTNSLDGCVEAVNSAEASLGATIVKTKQRLNEIATMMPEAKIVLIGYPQLIDNRPGVCDYDIHDYGVVYHAGEQIRQLGLKLDNEQSKLIDQMGGRFNFVSLKQLFDGHEVCGDQQIWIRDNLDTLIVNEWWHPNLEGYKVIANHLYSKGFHSSSKDVFRYGNLPLACGYTLPFVTTYGTMNSNGSTTSHGYAVDMPAVSGTAVLSPASGTAYRKYSSGYGNYVDVHGSDGRVHRMAHLQGSGLIANGTKVSLGQKVGLVGSTGYSTGPHVHYEQRIGGVQVKIVLDGPYWEWGGALDANGYRRTLHTVESANCSNPGKSSHGSDKQSELLIYSSHSGKRFFHDVRSDGSQQSVGYSKWTKGWDLVVTLEFDGDPYSEMILYDADRTSEKGFIATYDLYQSGSSPILWSSNRSSKYWTHLVPIDLDGDKRDELILYSADNGKYYIFDVSRTGKLKTIDKGKWSKNWKHIVPLEFDGDKGEEIVFYGEGSKRGRALVYSGSSKGIGRQVQRLSWINGWSHIVPLDIEGDGYDELIIYSAKSGRFHIHDVRRDGSQRSMVSDTWTKGWTLIVPLEVDGDRGSEVLFYKDRTGKKSRGYGITYDMTSIYLGRRMFTHNWINGWTDVLPIQLP